MSSLIFPQRTIQSKPYVPFRIQEDLLQRIEKEVERQALIDRFGIDKEFDLCLLDFREKDKDTVLFPYITHNYSFLIDEEDSRIVIEYGRLGWGIATDENCDEERIKFMDFFIETYCKGMSLKGKRNSYIRNIFEFFTPLPYNNS